MRLSIDYIYEKSVQSVDYNTKIQKIFEEIDKITQKKDKILEYNLNGKISDNEFLRRNDFFHKDLEKLETEIESLKQQQETEKLKLDEIYNIQKNLNNFKIINKEDLNENITNLFIDKIYAEPIDERHMNLKIVLSTGETENRIYEKILKSEK